MSCFHAFTLWILAVIGFLPSCHGVRKRVWRTRESIRTKTSYGKSYDTSMDGVDNANRAFEEFENALKLPTAAQISTYSTAAAILIDDQLKPMVEVFTEGEKAAYRARVIKELSDDSLHERLKGIANASDRDAAWLAAVLLALREQMPLITQFEINEINKLDLGWTAGNSMALGGAARETVVADLKDLAGVQLNDAPEQQEMLSQTNSQTTNATSLLEEGAPVHHVMHALHWVGGLLGAPQQQPGPMRTLPPEFQPHSKWRGCAQTFDNGRNQGSCGSCWAQAAASVLESRLCIQTNGRFSGPGGWISAEYLTTCVGARTGENGCAGFDPATAFTFAIQNGVPTGGQSTLLEADPYTCAPYFIGGNPVTNMLANYSVFFGTASNCPIQCSNTEYPRSLRDDLHKIRLVGERQLPESFVGGEGNVQMIFQERMMEYGPVVVSYQVFRDFMLYMGGIYTRSNKVKLFGVAVPLLANSMTGYHAVVGLGWGPGFFILKNSWGTWWGESGKFRVNARQLFTNMLPAFMTDLGVIDARNSRLPSLR